MEIIIINGVYAQRGSVIWLKSRDSREYSGLFVTICPRRECISLWEKDTGKYKGIPLSSITELKVLEEDSRIPLSELYIYAREEELDESLLGSQIHGFRKVGDDLEIFCSKDGEFCIMDFPLSHARIVPGHAYRIPGEDPIQICIGKDLNTQEWVFVSYHWNTLSRLSEEALSSLNFVERISLEDTHRHSWKIVNPEDYVDIRVVFERFYFDRMIIFGYDPRTMRYAIRTCLTNYIHPESIGCKWASEDRIYLHLGDYKFLDMDSQEIVTRDSHEGWEYLKGEDVDLREMKKEVYGEWARKYPKDFEKILAEIGTDSIRFLAVFDNPSNLKIVAYQKQEPRVFVISKNNLDDCI